MEQVTLRAAEIRAADVDALKAAGWSEEAIYDAITVAALFGFYNRWCDAAGVHAMSDEAHAAAAKATARGGYTVEL